MMTTEFDKVFDQIETPEYPATCDNCGEVGTNASMEQHVCTSQNHDAPAAPERGEWHADSSGGWGYVWQGGACLAKCPEPSRAQQIVTEHNQYSTLIAQRERLLAIVRDALRFREEMNGKCDHDQMMPKLCSQCEIRGVITTSEQEGRRR